MRKQKMIMIYMKHVFNLTLLISAILVQSLFITLQTYFLHKSSALQVQNIYNFVILSILQYLLYRIYFQPFGQFFLILYPYLAHTSSIECLWVLSDLKSSYFISKVNVIADCYVKSLSQAYCFFPWLHLASPKMLVKCQGQSR